jgi:hypothetical protein
MKKILFVAFIFASLTCFSTIAFTQTTDYQLKKGTFIFKSAYHATHSADLISHDKSSGEDSGAYQNYISKLQDEGLVEYYREPIIVNIVDIKKHGMFYGGTYITVQFVKVREKNGNELGWVSRDDLTKLKKKK